MQEPQVFPGKSITDTRGTISFVNDFTFKNVKRFYEIIHTEATPRAFHGHMKEEKYVYVTSGEILLCLVHLDDPKNPSKKNKVYKYILNSENPTVVHIPAGYANGFKVLKKDSKVTFYSTHSVEESKNDDFRFSFDYWGAEIWN